MHLGLARHIAWLLLAWFREELITRGERQRLASSANAALMRLEMLVDCRSP